MIKVQLILTEIKNLKFVFDKLFLIKKGKQCYFLSLHREVLARTTLQHALVAAFRVTASRVVSIEKIT